MTLNSSYVPTCLIFVILRNILREFERYLSQKEDLETREARETDSSKFFGFSKDSRSPPEIVKVKISRPDKFRVKSVKVIFRIKYFLGNIFRKIIV